ncbi:ABC transporter substrate-binding protein [Leucobacter sp. M11]|uniref:ABC transporter substrate-binding protein n=1 Tax=Leucobacter sp. M11 TaxID=2993565 RepID=UPI002D7F1336|nr:ABC transporter substrate-binding protein [Leucobacter sp. M11]MEB4613655.1 ABC transporter substrate-binding protein [Leucobacter sp. M11]
MSLIRPTQSGASARRGGIAALTLIAALALTGCASGTPSGDPAASGGGGGHAESGAFPVSIEHAFGEAKITEEPERVVTLGWAAEDAVVAFGVVPVAVPEYGWGADEDGYLPWFREAVEATGSPMPETLNSEDRAGEVNFEQILGLEPDVILAPFSGITEEDYERLSEIAPTVAFAEKPWASSWQEMTTVVGQALGQPERAKELLAETEAQIAEQGAAHPEFQGVTFAYGMGMPDGASELTLYFPADPRVEIIEGLGFVTPPSIVDFAASTGASSSESISLELLPDIDDAEVFLAWAGSEEDANRTLKNPVVSGWGPVAAGKDLVLTEPSLVWATSSPTVLNIGWALDELVPQLSELVKRS